MSLLQGAGLKALVALTGSKKNYSDARGCFQLGMWKQALDRHDAARIQSLVDQGVLLGLYAIDEPHDWPCGPSFEDIDAACAYAGQKWPNLKCGVNAPPAWLKPGASKLTHVGFLFFQYSNKKGTPGGMAQGAARRCGLVPRGHLALDPAVAAATFRERVPQRRA